MNPQLRFFLSLHLLSICSLFDPSSSSCLFSVPPFCLSALFICHLFPSLPIIPRVICHLITWPSSHLCAHTNLSSVNCHSGYSSCTFTFSISFCPPHRPLFSSYLTLALTALCHPSILSLSFSLSSASLHPCFSFETSEVCLHLLRKCHVNLDKKAP